MSTAKLKALAVHVPLSSSFSTPDQTFDKLLPEHAGGLPSVLLLGLLAARGRDRESFESVR